MGKRKHFSPPLFLSTDLFRCFVNRSVTGFSSILPVWGDRSGCSQAYRLPTGYGWQQPRGSHRWCESCPVHISVLNSVFPAHAGGLRGPTSPPSHLSNICQVKQKSNANASAHGSLDDRAANAGRMISLSDRPYNSLSL